MLKSADRGRFQAEGGAVVAVKGECVWGNNHFLLADQTNENLQCCWLGWVLRDAMKKRACLLTISEKDNVRPFVDRRCLLQIRKFA